MSEASSVCHKRVGDVWVCELLVIIRKQSDQCLPRRLNERAMQVMGRWRLRLSACVILHEQSEQCLPRALSERAMDRWHLSVCVILCEQS